MAEVTVATVVTVPAIIIIAAAPMVTQTVPAHRSSPA